MTPPRPPARRAHRPLARRHVHLRRQARRGVRGRHDRLRAVRGRAQDLLALVQVPPPPRRDGLGGPGRELAGAGRRRARASAPRSEAVRDGHGRRAPERLAVAGLRRHADVGHRGRPVHPARLLLQDLQWPAPRRGRSTSARCAASPASGGSPSARTTASGARSTAAATATCWSSAAGSPGCRPRSPRPARAPTSCSPTTTSSRAARCSPRAATSASARWPTRPAPPASRCCRSAPALGFYDGLVPIWQGDTLHQVRAQRHVAATGAIEQPLVFKDNDLPGVMMTGGARRLAALWAVRPGTTAVVATTGDRGLDAALALREAGVEIAAIADLRPDAADRELGAARAGRGHRGCCAGTTVVRALGRNGVAGARPRARRPVGQGRRARSSEIACDLLAVSGGTAPATSLLLQSGARARYDAATRRFLAELCPPASSTPPAPSPGTRTPTRPRCPATAAGARRRRGARPRRRDRQARADERAQAPRRAPAAVPGRGAARLRARRPPGREGVRRPRRGHHGEGHRLLRGRGLRLDRAVQALHDRDDGPLAGAPLAARLDPRPGRGDRARSLDDVGITTARPPWSTVPMGALAGRPFEPAKRSAIHGRHRELGANVKWAGDWRRAYDYGDPEGEAKAVHDAAGLIDVSTLGKLLVRGPDAGAFLDRLYPNRVSNLKPGRIRYGVLTREPGRITDDGTIARLDDDDVLRHDDLQRRRRGRQLVHAGGSPTGACDVHITDVTQAFAAMNLAGPRVARDPAVADRRRLSAEALTYLDALPAQVAGVSCLVLRIGFVGELGYEIHCPAPHGAGPLGRAHAGRRASTASARSAWSRSASCACRSCTSSSGRTRTRSRRRSARRCRGSSSSTRSEDFIGALGARARRRASGRHRARRLQRCPDGDVPTEGAASSTRAVRRSARSPARATAARSARSSAWRGCRPRRPQDGAHVDDLLRRAARTTRPYQTARSTTPRGGAALMSLAFLIPRRRPGAGAGCRSHAARWRARRSPPARRFERRDGWNVAVRFDAPERGRTTVGFADVSHLRKIGDPGRRRRHAGRRRRRAADGAWHCVLTPTRALVIGGHRRRRAWTSTVHAVLGRDDDRRPDGAGDVRALLRAGPAPARSRPSRGLAPRLVARTPGLRDARGRRSATSCSFGSAYGEYLWTVVADAAGHLGGAADRRRRRCRGRLPDA